MQDLKYEAITLETTYREILNSLKTSDLTAVTTTFIINVDRVYGLLRLPLVIPHVMRTIVSVVVPALGQVGGPPTDLDIPAQLKQVIEFFKELASEHGSTQFTPSAAIELLNTKLKALSDQNSDSTRDFIFLMTVIINIMKVLTFTNDASGNLFASLIMNDADALAWSRTINGVIAFIGTPARVGFEGILTGSIVGTWTAIEALAGDLWEAALNAEPEILSKLNGLHRKKGKNESNKQLDLDYIH